MFRRKKELDKVEARFNTAMNLIKDLDKTEFNRLMEAMKLAHEAYQKVRKVRTIDEKQNGNPDIDDIEKSLENEETKKKEKNGN